MDKQRVVLTALVTFSPVNLPEGRCKMLSTVGRYAETKPSKITKQTTDLTTMTRRALVDRAPARLSQQCSTLQRDLTPCAYGTEAEITAHAFT